MPQNYSLIQTITLSSTATSIDFVNIPQNFTDLKLAISARNNQNSIAGNLLLSFNDSSSGYLNIFLQGNGSSIGSGVVNQMIGDMNTNTSPANQYNNIEVYINNYTSSLSKNFNAFSAQEENQSGAYLMQQANIWQNSAAVNKISLTNRTGGLSFLAGCTVSLYGVGGTKAAGGTITSDSYYTYHTFTSSGLFTPFEKIKNCEALIVAGGGAGGTRGGGGGAGGVVYAFNQTATAGSGYSIIVGSGGTPDSNTTTLNTSTGSGTDSFALGFRAIGGGKGGGVLDSGDRLGYAGGSSGGNGPSGISSGTSATQTTSGSNFIGFGNAGGGKTGSGGQDTGGGGGGAGLPGRPGDNVGPGIGGVGTSNFTIWGAATQTGQSYNGVFYYAGGGGAGGNSSASPGGLGGGGNGGQGGDNATAGTANTGGGGGGGGNLYLGKTGGSGIVIIRYPN